MNQTLPPRSTWRRVAGALTFAIALGLPLGALLCAADADPAEAQSKKERKKAKEIFAAGQEDFKAGRFTEAGVKFLQAYDLDPHPAILFNVGRAFEEAGELVKALTYYKQALGLSPSEKIEGEVVAKIKEIELFLRAQGVDVMNLDSARWAPRGLVSVETDPPGAEVLLNNKSFGKTPLDKVAVPQGVYTVEVRKRGFNPVYRDVTVVGGKTYLLSPELLPEEMSPSDRKVGYVDVSAPRRGLMVFINGEPQALTPVGGLELKVGEYRVSVEDVEGDKDFPPFETTVTVEEGQTRQVVATYPRPIVVEQEDTSLFSQTGWGLIVTGAGGLTMATGLVFGVVAQQDQADYQNMRSAINRPDLRDSANSNALIADVFYGVGLGVAITGVTLILLDDGGEEAPGYDQLVEGVGVDLAPAVSAQGAGLDMKLTW